MILGKLKRIGRTPKTGRNNGQRRPVEDFAVLHIGKTGGTSINRLLKRLDSAGHSVPVTLLGHQYTLKRLLNPQHTCKIGFVIRDPADRFVSGFNSRLRAGRPSLDNPWRVSEAAAFGFFPTANDLAEALTTDDERLRSAAAFAIETIPHLKRGFAFHLGSVRQLKKASHRIYCVAELENLNEDIYRLFEPAGVSRDVVAAHYQAEHRAPSTGPALSEKGIANLRTFWADEFKIYDYCRTNLVRR